MPSLETQCGQIYINNKRLSKSFVSVFAEKVSETNAEIYTLIEIPILNPAAWSEYDRMSKSIESIFKKNFRRENPNAFENSIAQINEYLSKLAGEGHTFWVGKMNACLSVRQGDELSISTTGKVHAYLIREGQLSDLADRDAKSTALKAFSNFAVGKIKKKDFVIFSTAQLFNYVSLEKFQSILQEYPISGACQHIGELIRESADETVSFGTQIIEVGSSSEMLTENINKFTSISNVFEKESLKNKAIAASVTAIGITKNLADKTMHAVRNVDVSTIKSAVKPENLKVQFKNYTDVKKIKNLSKSKKFFLITAVCFVVLLIINIYYSAHVKSKKQVRETYLQSLANIENEIKDSNNAAILNDGTRALSLMSDARIKFNSLSPAAKSDEQKFQEINKDLNDLEMNIGKVRNTSTNELAKVESAKSIALKGKTLIIGKENSVSLFNKDTGSQEKDYNLQDSLNTLASSDNMVFYKDDQGGIYKIDESQGTVEKQKATLPNTSLGLYIYGSPLRAYAVDKNNNQVLYINLTNDQTPLNYLKDNSDLSQTLDFSIDGSVYVLNKNGIQKFLSGKTQNFTNPFSQYSEGSKIKAEEKYLYIMEKSLRRVIVLDKNGALIGQYVSGQFNDLKDISIDEPTSTVYILNGRQLLSFKLNN